MSRPTARTALTAVATVTLAAGVVAGPLAGATPAGAQTPTCRTASPGVVRSGSAANQCGSTLTGTRPSPPVASWGLEAYPGVTQSQALADAAPALGDTDGTGPLTADTPLTANGVTWAQDVHLIGGQTVSLDGATSQLTTAGPVLNPSASFSVAAWVRLGANGDLLPTSDQTVLAQDGDHVGSFVLGYQGGEQQRWTFRLRGQDVDGAATVGLARATAKPVTGQWTHLAGVYDAAAGVVRLYVNGKLAAADAVSAAPQWPNNGAFAVGREKVNGTAVNFWSGQIAGVRAYDRVIVDQDFFGWSASDPASGGFDEPGIVAPVQVGQWDFETAIPCFVQDLADTCEVLDGGQFGRTLALTRGADILSGNRGNGLQLDGWFFPNENPQPWEATQEYGRSAYKTGVTDPDENGNQYSIWQDTSVLRTDQSFTVSVWSRIEETTGRQTLVAQESPGYSGFDLQYAPDNGGLWSFILHGDPSDTEDTRSLQVTTAAVNPTGWHHLVGVLDAGNRQLRLYVDGVLAGTTSLTPAWQPWQANGPLVVGRTKTPAGPTDWLHGRLDDLFVYQGASTDAQVYDLYRSQALIVS